MGAGQNEKQGIWAGVLKPCWAHRRAFTGAAADPACAERISLEKAVESRELVQVTTNPLSGLLSEPCTRSIRRIHTSRTVWNDKDLGSGDSVKANGIVQPIIVRRYRADTAHRRRARVRAARWSGSRRPGGRREVSDEQLFEWSWSRTSTPRLESIERAKAYHTIWAHFLTQTEAADDWARTACIANYLRLLDLPTTQTDARTTNSSHGPTRGFSPCRR